jgi:probable HAF family extracellular repeat protein
MNVVRSLVFMAVCFCLNALAGPPVHASVVYTFSGINSGPGGNGLSVALQYTAPGFVTSLTPLLASQLDSCTNCFVSTTIPAAEIRPHDTLGDAIGFVDVNLIEFFYRFPTGAFSTPGTYQTLSEASYPGTLTVSITRPSQLIVGTLGNHAVLWQDGVARDLGTLGSDSYGYAINSSGLVIGDSLLPDFRTHAFLWKDGVMTDLGTLGGNNSAARGINSSGQVVGTAKLSDGAQHAFLWQEGVGMRDLGTLGGLHSSATGINASGQIVGYSYLPASSIQHAFLWQEGMMTDLGTLGGSESLALGINDSGQVVGYSSLADNTTRDAFLWQEGVMTDLGSFGGHTSSATSINVCGEVVGTSDLPDGTRHAFLWRNGVMTDLGTLDGDNTDALGINSSAQVVGAASLPFGTTHAFLWEESTGMRQLSPGDSFSIAFGIADAINADPCATPGAVANDHRHQ